MKKNNIFIHIPKTGGTTINTAMYESYWLTEPNFNYRHIVEKTKKSNAGDIFLKQNQDKYKDYNIFTMLRHPIDKVISEYYFFKERENLMNFFLKRPTSLSSYIKNNQSKNSTINFLMGRRLYDTKKATSSDLERILETAESLPIHIGIFEEFAKSMQYFSAITDIKWKKEIEVKRITFKRPSINELSDEIKSLIIENNELDMALYDYGLNKFNALPGFNKNENIQFKKDKYTHVIPYVAKTCLFEFCMDNKTYIKKNFSFFKDLTFYLLKEKRIRDGRTYVKAWNSAFVESVRLKFGENNFFKSIEKQYLEANEPLDQTYNIGRCIDLFLKTNKKEASHCYSPMKFNKELVIIPNQSQQKKIGLFSKWFRK